MKLSEFNWNALIFAALGVSVVINVVIVLLAIFLYSGNFFSTARTDYLENYLFFFSLSSPLTASLLSSSIVFFRNNQARLQNTIVSTILTFILTLAILILVTNPVYRIIYTEYDRKAHPCHYRTCGE